MRVTMTLVRVTEMSGVVLRAVLAGMALLG
jgi:hypothetical protein